MAKTEPKDDTKATAETDSTPRIEFEAPIRYTFAEEDDPITQFHDLGPNELENYAKIMVNPATPLDATVVHAVTMRHAFTTVMPTVCEIRKEIHDAVRKGHSYIFFRNIDDRLVAAIEYYVGTGFTFKPRAQGGSLWKISWRNPRSKSGNLTYPRLPLIDSATAAARK